MVRIVCLTLLSYLALCTEGICNPVTVTSVFNNVPSRAGLKTGWGYACLIEGMEKTVLFDTGADGRRLLLNMRHLGKRPEVVDTVVLSHSHQDHVGGLKAFLVLNPHVTVYAPASFSSSLKSLIGEQKAKFVAVAHPMRIAPAVFLTISTG
jgi:7,8-dihydropterin-6-yl-methyl-4-(beta-D-ribofuranosyl)aminobenzene 5'-phosphate synthase